MLDTYQYILRNESDYRESNGRSPICINCGDPIAHRTSKGGVCSRCRRSSIYERQYRVDLDKLELMLYRQGDCCAICNTEISLEKPITAHVDHDHTTGRVRGILCGLCNKGLGMFRDNVKSLKRAIEYIEQASPASPPSQDTPS